jgi:hypothetical protein
MRKAILVLVTVFFALPALAIAGSPPSSADVAAAVKQCSSERSVMGLSIFKSTYGTNANRTNAFGKCVSARARQNEQNRSNAAAQCRTARSADPTGFASTYGTGKNHANAFGNCVSAKAKQAAAAQVQATENAAKACSAERKLDPAAFKAKYGTNANKSNAFGKCVSGKVKQSGS